MKWWIVAGVVVVVIVGVVVYAYVNATSRAVASALGDVGSMGGRLGRRTTAGVN